MQTDWEGRPVPDNEPDDKLIKVWEVSPHPQTNQYDYMLERSWQKMLDIVSNNLDLMLERDIEEGLTLNFRVVEMRKSAYDEIMADE